MLFDLLYEIGGDVLVQLADGILGPLFEWSVTGWPALASILERLLS